MPIAAGTPLPGTAKLQATLDATAYFAGPMDSSGRFSAVLAHTGKRQAQIDSPIQLAAYSTLDLRLTLSWSTWEVSAFLNNATNTQGISGAVDYTSILYTEFYPVRPRTAGVAVRYDF